jgi:hypothetical protein
MTFEMSFETRCPGCAWPYERSTISPAPTSLLNFTVDCLLPGVCAKPNALDHKTIDFLIRKRFNQQPLRIRALLLSEVLR